MVTRQSWVFEAWEGFNALLMLLRWRRPCSKEQGCHLGVESSPWMTRSKANKNLSPITMRTWILLTAMRLEADHPYWLHMRTQLSWHLDVSLRREFRHALWTSDPQNCEVMIECCFKMFSSGDLLCSNRKLIHQFSVCKCFWEIWNHSISKYDSSVYLPQGDF